MFQKILSKEIIDFIKPRFLKKFKDKNDTLIAESPRFELALQEYLKLKPFKPSGNIWESGQEISKEAHYILRLITQYHLTEAFKAMLIDLEDENVKESDSTGNIGTPGRIAKMWCSSSTDDNTEQLSGRWIKEPRMASFESDCEDTEPIWIETQIRAVCSHHFIGFHNNPKDNESRVVIGYIPEKGVRGGISKISRYVRDFASRRAWLQEDLANYIADKIQDKFKTKSVFVGLYKINHGCTWTRGANDQDAGTTTIVKRGVFKDIEIPEKYKA